MLLGLAVPAAQAPAPAPAALSCADMESFLKTAKIGRQRSIPVGVTIPSRATLENGEMQHDAAIQTLDERKSTYSTPRGTELNFRDSWQFNIAGYELAKMLELNMVPPYVERRVQAGPASVSWWINDAMMERDRMQKKIQPPDAERWNKEMYAVRLFHELIGDSDFNMTNILISKDWRIWMIDFSRAFRLTATIQNPKGLRQIDRKLLGKLREIGRQDLQQRLGRWLSGGEIAAVLTRRDLLVKHFDAALATNGESAVLYELPRTAERCGEGLQ
jgi:hypothetical protein